MKIPTLKFTLKGNCKALNEGRNTLETLKSTSRFGVKIVQIDEDCPGRTKGKKDFIPDRHSRLEPGFKVWIIPHLSKWVKWVKGQDDKTVFGEAYEMENIYKKNGNAVIVLAGDKDGHSDMERVRKADLIGFMDEFSLKEKDLKLDMLPCYGLEYRRQTAASVCTVDFAKKLLEEEKNNPQLLDRLRSREGKVELLALNMRNNFRVSPVAVMHWGPNEEKFEIEIPETVRTILHKNDHLVFLQSDWDGIKQSMQNLNSDDGIVDWKEWNLPELEGDAAVYEIVRVEDVPVPRAPVRRGGGGGKS